MTRRSARNGDAEDALDPALADLDLDFDEDDDEDDEDEDDEGEVGGEEGEEGEEAADLGGAGFGPGVDDDDDDDDGFHEQLALFSKPLDSVPDLLGP